MVCNVVPFRGKSWHRLAGWWAIEVMGAPVSRTRNASKKPLEIPAYLRVGRIYQNYVHVWCCVACGEISILSNNVSLVQLSFKGRCVAKTHPQKKDIQWPRLPSTCHLQQQIRGCLWSPNQHGETCATTNSKKHVYPIGSTYGICKYRYIYPKKQPNAAKCR